MIVPNRHTAEFESLAENESLEMMTLASKCLRALQQVMNPDGFNIGMNLGRVAGAGIAEHLHLHIVPRWDADTNFMPVLGHTKIVSEGLLETWDKLKPFLEKQ
jgi:ATP adenylyltransferase